MGSVLVPAQARRVLHARAVHVQGWRDKLFFWLETQEKEGEKEKKIARKIEVSACRHHLRRPFSLPSTFHDPLPPSC